MPPFEFLRRYFGQQNLTTGFIAGLQTLPKYKILWYRRGIGPVVQVVSTKVSPSAQRLKDLSERVDQQQALLLGSNFNKPEVRQWLTISDGKYCVPAVVIHHGMGPVRLLKLHSTFEIIICNLNKFSKDSPSRNMLLLLIHLFEIKQRSAPEPNAADLEEVLDAKPNSGPKRKDAIEVENFIYHGFHPTLHRSIKLLERMGPGDVYESETPHLAMNVTSIRLLYEGDVWVLGLTDGQNSIQAYLRRSGKLSDLERDAGIEGGGTFENNNAEEIMVKGERGLAVGDTICVLQCVKLFDCDRLAPNLSIWLTVVCILRKANGRN